MLAADAVIEMITAQIPSGFHWADFAAGAVGVQLELLEDADVSERAELERRARKGCQVLARTAWTFHGIRPRRWLLRGGLEWERGRRDRAERAWRKAESIAVAMELDFDVARARLRARAPRCRPARRRARWRRRASIPSSGSAPTTTLRIAEEA